MAVGPAGQRFAFALEGASATEGTAAGIERTYPNALPGVSASYVSSPDSVRETLSLASAGAPTVYRYKLSLSAGLRAALTPRGGLDITNASGKRVYWLAAPTVTDSSATRSFRASQPVHYELSADGSTLSLVLDHAWLVDPKRVFPVKIDPEVYFFEGEDCSIISQAYANTHECGGPLFVGADSASPKNVSRTLVHFDLSCIPRDINLLQSRLRLSMRWHVGSTPLNIQAQALTRSFTSGATWNKYNGTTGWTTPGGDYEASPVGQQTVGPSNEYEYLSWGFSPQVERWLQEPSSNHGVVLKSENESIATYYAFEQSDPSEAGPEPYMELIYEPRLGDPENQTLINQPLGNIGSAGVNVINGNFNVTNPDVKYEAEGYETELSRSYNSQDDLLPGAALHLWRLAPAEDTPLYHTTWDGANSIIQADGSDLRFDREPSGDGVPSAGDKAFGNKFEPSKTLIEHSDGSRTLTDGESGMVWTFTKTGFVEKVVDGRGEENTLSLSYSYEKLTGAADTHGHTLTITRDPYSSYVTKIKSATGEEWKYTYDASSRLTSYKGPGGHEAEYGYTSTDKLNKIVDASGTYVVIYDGSNRVTSLRRLVNGTIATPGSEDEVTAFSYKAPVSPTCNPETDSGETVVTRTPGTQPTATYCYNAIGHVTGYTGPSQEAEEEATTGLEEQEEIPVGTCYEDPAFPKTDCGQNDPGAENTEGGEGFAPLVSGLPADIGAINYGIAENNRLANFNAFTNPSFKNLHVGLMRRTVPWDEVWEGVHASNTTAVAHYNELKEWVTKVKALGSGTGQPTISFDRCETPGKWVNPLKAEQIDCKTTPTVPQYEAAMKAVLEDATLSGVTHYSAWNEPDNSRLEGEPTAEHAGQYWRALDKLCVGLKSGCQVAAGEFLDTEMPNANDKTKGGGAYFKAYAHAMGHAPTAKHWAWHAYTDGETAGTRWRGKPAEWWKRYKNFKKAVNKASHGPDVWLTEQGVRYYIKNKPLAAHESGDTAAAIMRAYVASGSNQLTRQGKVTKFFYYQMRGDQASQDSGLLTPVSAQRAIYGIYRSKTPQK